MDDQRADREGGGMLEEISWILIGLVCLQLGSMLGKILVALRGERWRNSIRGLMFATALSAIALYLLVTSWPK
jgi:hypothetical protein